MLKGIEKISIEHLAKDTELIFSSSLPFAKSMLFIFMQPEKTTSQIYVRWTRKVTLLRDDLLTAWLLTFWSCDLPLEKKNLLKLLVMPGKVTLLRDDLLRTCLFSCYFYLRWSWCWCCTLHWKFILLRNNINKLLSKSKLIYLQCRSFNQNVYEF